MPTDPSPPASSPSTGRQPSCGELLLFVGGCALLLAIVFWPWTFGRLSGMSDSATKTYWGEVRQIRFVGTFGPSTQIDTDLKSFLVWGVATLDKGTRLEKREDYFNRQICIVGTPQCWGLAGR